MLTSAKLKDESGLFYESFAYKRKSNCSRQENSRKIFAAFLARLLETAARYAMILKLAHLIAAASSYLADGVALVTTSLRRTGYVETCLLDDCLVGNDASNLG